MNLSINTPCIGVCSTGIGDSVCRGCKRFAHEVIRWNTYSDEQKHSVNQRLDYLLSQIISERIDVFDRDRLKKQLQRQNIRFDEHASENLWAFQLLKAGARQISSLDTFGCRVLPDWQGRSLEALKCDIDQVFFSLSCAHYERYFLQGAPLQASEHV